MSKCMAVRFWPTQSRERPSSVANAGPKSAIADPSSESLPMTQLMNSQRNHAVVLVAFTDLLMADFRQSKRRAGLFLESLLGQPCCAALAVKMQHQVTAALRPRYDALVAQWPTQPHLGIDESPTKQAASKAWL